MRVLAQLTSLVSYVEREESVRAVFSTDRERLRYIKVVGFRKRGEMVVLNKEEEG